MIETVGIEGVIETVIGNLRRGIETEGGVEKEKGTGIEMVIETDIGIKDDEAILLIKCFVKKKKLVYKNRNKILNLFIFICFLQNS